MSSISRDVLALALRLALPACGLSTHALIAQQRSEITMPPNGDNQQAEVSQWIGLVKVTIAYHSPRVHLRGVKDRTGHIWGELLPYGLYDEGFGPSHAAPWRAGADESTELTVSHDVRVGGQELKAGRYALFLELAATGPWTWILSDNPGWGAFQYDPKDVVLRIPVVPQDAPFTEFLTYGFDDRLPNSTTAYLQWEKKRIPLHIDVPNVNELYAAQMGRDLREWPGFNYQNWQAAAQFAADNKVDLDEALVWADKALYEPFRNAAEGRIDFSTLQTKAAVLSAMGREADADTTMDHAIHSEGATAPRVHSYGMTLLTAGRTERALQVFKMNAQRHPDDKFWPHVGLARIYTALGDKRQALSHWHVALQHVPPDQERQRPQLAEAVRILESSGAPRSK